MRNGGQMSDLRQKVLTALAKPTPQTEDDLSVEFFNPWHDILTGITGSYSEDMDELMIVAMRSVLEKECAAFRDGRGLAGEFALHVLAGHDLTDYGTWPGSAWVNYEIRDLWEPLIEKWEAYAAATWGQSGASVTEGPGNLL